MYMQEFVEPRNRTFLRFSLRLQISAPSIFVKMENMNPKACRPFLLKKKRDPSEHNKFMLHKYNTMDTTSDNHRIEAYYFKVQVAQ